MDQHKEENEKKKEYLRRYHAAELAEREYGDALQAFRHLQDAAAADIQFGGWHMGAIFHRKIGEAILGRLIAPKK